MLKNQNTQKSVQSERARFRLLQPGLLGWIPFWFALTAQAAPQFSASVESQEVAQDESVTLKLTVKLDGSSEPDSAPRFEAKDFTLVNEYSEAPYLEAVSDGSTYRTTQTLTYVRVLQPKKMGSLTIGGFSVRVEGQVLTAPAVKIQVGPGGSATEPPSGYGGGGTGLRGAAKNLALSGGFKVRAEVDKSQVFKGEPLIASFYLYSRGFMSSPEVSKYPAFSDFLREDLEMPILNSGALPGEQVVLDGAVYTRYLLARYQLIPVKTGKLTVDPMVMKAEYRPQLQDLSAEDALQMAYQMMMPRSGVSSSDPITIEVLPVPTAGRPESFSGGIGNFEISASADRASLRQGESFRYTVRVQGKGDLSSIQAPVLKLPEGFEKYETQVQVRGGKGGPGEKVFETLILAKKPGRWTLPAIEFSAFDPSHRTFSRQSAPEITLEVLPGEGMIQENSASPAVPSAGQPAGGASSGDSGGAEAKVARADRSERWRGWMGAGWADRLSVVLASVGFGAGLWIFGWAPLRQRGRKWIQARRDRSSDRKASRRWKRIEKGAGSALQSRSAPFAEVVEVYEQLSGVLFDALDARYGLGARSRPRQELGGLLQSDHGMAPTLWERVDRLLEYAETVRYAAGSGAVSELEARQELPRWVAEARVLESLLEASDG